MIKEAILLAGGQGTRLQKVVSDVPKPMAPVAGRPFIEYVLDYLIKSGIEKFIFSVGYKADAFTLHFGKNYQGRQIEYSIEKTQLGTGGGIKKALGYATEKDVLVVNADTIFKVDIPEFYDQHKKTGADLSMALRYVDDVSRYGCVVTNEKRKVIAFSEKNKVSGEGNINGGVYIFKKDFFDSLNLPEVFSLEKDCMEKFIDDLRIVGFPSESYFLDIGIPEDYEKAKKELF
jgi:D-glycero-alpha-D-manno-heptose 1-phosphate guanylyltransferase